MFFVPWKNDFRFGEKNSGLKLGHKYKQHQFCFASKYSKNNPCFGLIRDSITPKAFVDALIEKNFDDAMSYVSKFSVFMDFEAVKKIFDGISSYNCVSASFTNSVSKEESVNSIFVSDKNKKVILRFYLVNEPDCFSKWKIYRIEEEYVTSSFERKKLCIKF